MKRMEIDCATGKVLEIELSAAEIKAYDKRIADDEHALLTKQIAADQAASDKAALLAKIGITADEAKLLLS